MIPNAKALQVVRDHYRLRRPVTQAELDAEVANIRRRGLAHLDDRLARLAARLDIFPIGTANKC